MGRTSGGTTGRQASRTALTILLFLFAAPSAINAQQPVGLVFESGNVTIQRPGRELGIAAVPGSELFAGDVVHAEAGSIRFSFCPAHSVQTISHTAPLVLDSSGINLTFSAIRDRQSLKFCDLPIMERLPALQVVSRRPAILKGTFESRARELAEGQRTGLTRVLATLDAAINNRTLDPYNSDIELAVARAALLEEYGLFEDAIAAYDAIYARWPGVAWAAHAASRLVKEADTRVADASIELRGVRPAVQQPIQPESGPHIRKTYAVLIGISQYRPESGIPWLSFADRDAETFAQHLEQPRGGSLRRCTDASPSDCEIKILTNESATLANIANTLQSFVREHAARDHELIVFLAAHGIEPAMEKNWNDNGGIRLEPTILTYDSDYNETKTTGYAMSQLREDIAQQGLLYGKVMLFVDVCRAGNIGPIAGTSKLQPAVRDIFTFRKGAVGLFMATQAQDDAYESSQFGDGHGAFTYSVLNTLNPQNPPAEKRLDFQDVLSQVQREVRDLTRDQQVPTGAAVDQRMIVEEDATLPGIKLDPASPIASKKALRRPRGERPSAPKDPRADIPKATTANEFLQALAAGRLRRDEGSHNARDALDAVPQVADAAGMREFRDQLRTALENRGQQVVLSYLRGDQEPQKREKFESCGQDFAAALELDPRMSFDESRMLFCQGRALIYPSDARQKDYANAARLLERAIRLDPGRAYAYNALGIAYLEQVPQDASYYDLAVAAFHDAIRRAPYWPYPWHNLALALTERGNYEEAEGYYRHAMELAPLYSYLPYNLGLLYQRINRIEDAETYYRRAINVAREANRQGITTHPSGQNPEEAEANNALGTLAFEAGNRSKARRYYLTAIELDGNSLTARHNLALLASARSGRSIEAERLWSENLKLDPQHLPSLVARATYLARERDWNGAARDWAAVLLLAPEHLNAKLQLARAYIATHQSERALPLLKAAEGQAPSGAEAWIEIGDLFAAVPEDGEAREAYKRAFAAAEITGDGALILSVKKKLATVPARDVDR